MGAAWSGGDGVRGCPTAKPESVGMSSKRLDQLTALLKSAVADRPELGPEYPHVRVVVLKAPKRNPLEQDKSGRMKLVYDETAVAAGFDRPDEDSIYRWYSMSKIVTTVAIMQCYENGLLSLNDPISKFIPSFENTGVFVSCSKVPAPAAMEAMGIKEIPGEIQTEPQATPITVKHLLTHTAGFGYGGLGASMGIIDDVDLAYMTRGLPAPAIGGMLFGSSDEYSSLEGMCEIIAKLPLKFQPGTKFEYGIGHFVCGRIIEVVTGKDFLTYLEDEIFKPLDMDTAGFGEDAKTNNNVLKLYSYGPNEHTGLTIDIDQKLTPVQRGVPCYKTELAGNLVEVGSSGSNEHVDPCLRSEYVKAVKEKKAPISGDGGMTSTCSDYFKFMYMLANRGIGANGTRVLGAKSIECMFMNHLPDGKSIHEMENRVNSKGFGMQSDALPIKGMGFGLGGAVPIGDRHQVEDGCLAMPPGSYTWSGVAGTDIIIDPKNGLAYMFLTQVMFTGFNTKVNGMYGSGQFARLIMAALT